MANKTNDNKNLKTAILTIVAIIVIAIISIFTGQNLFDENTYNPSETTGQYENIGIDSSELNILYLNVGQGDSTFITINGYNMLIDAGKESDGYYITEFLKAQGIDRIDYLIGTHVDADHTGGIGRIIESFDIKNFYLPQMIQDDIDYERAKDAVAQKNNLKMEEKEQGYIFNLGEAKIEILSDKDKITKSANETSIILELTHKNTKYMFMGDAPEKIEKMIKLEKIDVLKVGHHGSKSSTSQKFIDVILPEYSIISVGTNSYGHPNNTIVERLKNVGKVYRTDEEGTVWLKSDGYEIEIELLPNVNVNGTYRKQQGMLNFLDNLLCYQKYNKNHLLVA